MVGKVGVVVVGKVGVVGMADRDGKWGWGGVERGRCSEVYCMVSVGIWYGWSSGY